MLTSTQETAYQEIRTQFETKNIVVLHGVTSSRKTKIYVQLIQKILSQKRKVLYLLPEINLTT